MNILKNKSKKTSNAITLFIFLFLMFIPKLFFAQSFQRFDYLPVSNFGTNLEYPWVGGLNSIQFGKVDANHDGIKDLVVYDKSNDKFCVFLATSNNSTHYIYNNKYASHFPSISGWMTLQDYNCDGIEDIFTYNGIANLKVYTGFYVNDTIQYKLQQDGFFYQNSGIPINVYCSDVIKPALTDVNGDGDIDVISFNVFGNRLIYYENQQKELNLPCDSLLFTKADNCWGNVRDTFGTAYSLRDTCNYKFSRISGDQNIMHTGSTIEATDIDKNGAVDVVIGSVTLNNLTVLYNNGNKNYASILTQDASFPSYDIPFATNSFGTPKFLDVDNNGTTDLLVSTFDVGAANINNIWYYKNISNTGTSLRLVQKNFLLDNMIDAGENSNPCFFDVDGDGLIDILIGSGGFKDNNNPAVYKLLFYKNIGTATQPAFNLVNDNFLNSSALNVKDIVPAVGDIDNDNDTDLIVGLSDGRIIYWENTATAGNPPNLIYRGYLKDIANNDISIGSNAAPYLVDLNRDGKTDLIIGERNGNLNYYQGTAFNAPKFSFITDSLGKILIKTNSIAIGYTQPTIADINNDGKYDLILGTNTSGLQFYNNIEDHINTNFVFTAPMVADYLGSRTTSTVADITGDGKMELLTGNIDGGLIIFSQNPPPNITTAIKNNILQKLDYDCYPNPANNSLHININNLKNKIKIQLFNSFGQEIFSKTEEPQNEILLNTNTLPNGIYFIKISDNEKVGSQKIIIQH